MLRRRPIFPARQRGLVAWMGAGLRTAEVGRHGGRPSSFTTCAARQRPAKPLGGRCCVGAHFSRATARPCRLDGGGAAPRESRTTRRSSLQFCDERGAGAPSEIPWRAVLRRRPFFPRASAALSAGWGRGCAPRKSDDTEVIPPVLLRARRGSRMTIPICQDAMDSDSFAECSGSFYQ